ncbi:MAG: beta-ketoacyl synthase N-terminal-like domain-containing protein, partial [bacterium]|nr:beta-ketoacyl synthase N-terminal-like domain-containing protein [bacterium]
NFGFVSLSTAEGLTAFFHALNQNSPNVLVLPGYQDRLVNNLVRRSLIHQSQGDHSLINSQDVAQKAEHFLKEIISNTLKIDLNTIVNEAAFENYGIDSLMIIQLNQQLALHFTDLPKTLFFEYKNLAELINYFAAHQAVELSQLNAVPPTRLRNSINPMSFSQKQLSFGQQPSQQSDIAIIGVSGRYPQANDLDEFWENLKVGKDCISEIPSDRWSVDKYHDTNKDSYGTSYSKWGGFLADVDKFDPLFFNISPREATLMDPQERLFLQTAWNTIEDAGYARTQLAGKKIGVYVGVMYGQYQLYGTEQSFVPTNSVFASIANRVSYFFDFHGPSIALDTMCSSSLTAIHLACKSLHDGESELALAGGVNLSLHPNKYLLLSNGKFLASDGHCRSFGEGGDGYVPGEGVGAVLLKPLAKALVDGDHIYAVIKGSQINHGGKTNGYTVPNPNAQADLIAETYQKAKINPSHVSYLEAHGTGTALGDPIEITGLNKVFGREGLEYCSIGSVKSNIGHCESASYISAFNFSRTTK